MHVIGLAISRSNTQSIVGITSFHLLQKCPDILSLHLKVSWSRYLNTSSANQIGVFWAKEREFSFLIQLITQTTSRFPTATLQHQLIWILSLNPIKNFLCRLIWKIPLRTLRLIVHCGPWYRVLWLAMAVAFLRRVKVFTSWEKGRDWLWRLT